MASGKNSSCPSCESCQELLPCRGNDGVGEDIDRMNRIDRIKSPLPWGGDAGVAEDFILSILFILSRLASMPEHGNEINRYLCDRLGKSHGNPNF